MPMARSRELPRTTVLTRSCAACGAWRESWTRARSRCAPFARTHRRCGSGLSRVQYGRYPDHGFFHEIVMMNYGGVLLTKEFLNRPTPSATRTACRSCARDTVLRLEFGGVPLPRIRPQALLRLGRKGFPGGEYPASRIVFSAAMDNDLPRSARSSPTARKNSHPSLTWSR